MTPRPALPTGPSPQMQESKLPTPRTTKVNDGCNRLEGGKAATQGRATAFGFPLQAPANGVHDVSDMMRGGASQSRMLIRHLYIQIPIIMSLTKVGDIPSTLRRIAGGLQLCRRENEGKTGSSSCSARGTNQPMPECRGGLSYRYHALADNLRVHVVLYTDGPTTTGMSNVTD